MRRILTGMAAVALLAGFSVSLHAAYSATGSLHEYALIDFNSFEENMASVVAQDQEIHEQIIAQEGNEWMDIGAYGYHEVTLTEDDFDMSNWQVELCSSADTVQNNIYSYCSPAESEDNGTVLGVRVHFPEWRFLSWAKIQPPFALFAQYDDGSYVNASEGENNSLTTGLLVNVGIIQSLEVQVYGLNYQHQLGVRLIDRDGSVQEFSMGNLYFHQWRTLSWVNPDYASDPNDRELEKVPLYPQSYPYVMFDSFVLYKPESDDGGDFITYFKDVWLTFEKAILEDDEDIDHEDIWNILSDEQTERRVDELKELSEEIYLRRQALRRMNDDNESIYGDEG